MTNKRPSRISDTLPFAAAKVRRTRNFPLYPVFQILPYRYINIEFLLCTFELLSVAVSSEKGNWQSQVEVSCTGHDFKFQTSAQLVLFSGFVIHTFFSTKYTQSCTANVVFLIASFQPRLLSLREHVRTRGVSATVPHRFSTGTPEHRSHYQFISVLL